MEPIPIAVRALDGELLVELVGGPHTTFGNLKAQIEGCEGTPAGNQTLLLGGRAHDDGATLASAGVFRAETLTLVRCAPLLSGRLSRRDLQRLVEDEAALSPSIDAFKENPRYDAAEVKEIISAVASALLPGDTALAAEILSSLPLDTLSEEGQGVATGGDAEQTGCEISPYAAWAVEAEAGCLRSPQGDADTAKFYDIGMDAPPLYQSRRREQREHFTRCVHAGLGVVYHALQPNSARSESGGAAESQTR